MNDSPDRSRKLLMGLTMVLLAVGLVQFVVLGGSDDSTEVSNLQDPSQLPEPGVEPGNSTDPDRAEADNSEHWTFPARPARVSPFLAEEGESTEGVEAPQDTVPDPPAPAPEPVAEAPTPEPEPEPAPEAPVEDGSTTEPESPESVESGP